MKNQFPGECSNPQVFKFGSWRSLAGTGILDPGLTSHLVLLGAYLCVKSPRCFLFCNHLDNVFFFNSMKKTRFESVYIMISLRGFQKQLWINFKVHIKSSKTEKSVSQVRVFNLRNWWKSTKLIISVKSAIIHGFVREF